jgi:hypothetical protein
LPKEYSQDQLDAQVVVPPGHVVALETTASGLLHYECKANATTAGTIGWVLVRPEAELAGPHRQDRREIFRPARHLDAH